MKLLEPKQIRLDASSICQLKCPVCHHASDSNLKYGFLRFQNFKQLIDSSPFIEKIELSDNGEIFLNPELLDIIKYGFDKNISLHADNGVNLNDVEESILEGLVKYKFHSLVCSIDGCSNETYKQYRVNGNFDKVIANIEKLNYYKNKYNSEFPKLTWQFIIFGHNEHEIGDAKERSKQLKMNFSLKLNKDAVFSPVINRALVRGEVGYASRDEYKTETGEMYFKSVCHQLWDSPTITWDGRVLGCCMNYELDFGVNAFKNGLLNAINSEQLGYARQMLIGEREPIDGIPCSDCRFYLHMRETGVWLKRE